MKNYNSNYFPILKTERCHLINLDTQYTKDVFTLFANENVTKYIDGINTFSHITEAEDIINVFQYAFKQKKAFFWGIKLLNNYEDATIGVIGVFEIKTESPKIFYALEPELCNKGLMTECLREIVKYCFDKLLIKSINAEVYLENKASIKLLINNGFVESKKISQKSIYSLKIINTEISYD